MNFDEICAKLQKGHSVNTEIIAIAFTRASLEEKSKLSDSYKAAYGVASSVFLFMEASVNEEQRQQKVQKVLEKYETNSPHYNLLQEVQVNEDFMSLVENLKGGRGKLEAQMRELVDDGMITIKNEGFSVKLVLTPLALRVISGEK